MLIGAPLAVMPSEMEGAEKVIHNHTHGYVTSGSKVLCRSYGSAHVKKTYSSTGATKSTATGFTCAVFSPDATF